MKTKLIKGLLILISAGALLTGCETDRDQATNFNQEFPPAPVAQNSP